MRRGSELNLPRLREAGVEFVHGDVREPADLPAAGPFDAMVECSAEPSVLAGFADASYSVQTNLLGAFNCLERARAEEAFVVFLSTSRVYPVAPQLELELEETETRFELAAAQPVAGAGPGGHRRGLPAGRRAHALRRDQALRRAADRGVRRRLRPARGDQPLRRDRRPLADGQGRPGRLLLVAAQPPLRPAALLHRLRRLRQAGARPAPHRRPDRPGRRAARRPGALERRHRQRRRRPRVQPLAAGDDRALPRADRQRGADRGRARDPARRRSGLPERLLAPAFSNLVAPSPRAARRARRPA